MTEHFSFKSGRTMWVMKLIKEAYIVTVRISASNNTFKKFIAEVLEYKSVLTEELNLHVLQCSP